MFGQFNNDLVDLRTGAVARPAEVLKAFDREVSFPPILVKRSSQKPQALISHSGKRVFLRKRCCGSVWCPKCFKRFFSPVQADRMSLMTWNRVRFVTLTLDRSLVGQGEEAYNWYKNTKPLGRFIQDLRRSGVVVTDWTANLEWHDDGSPHWHVLIETDKSGKAGQIGQGRLHDRWPYGRIHEGFFKSENQFKDFLGYFQKSGYLHKDKQHQIELPSWSQADHWRGAKINRFSSMRRPGVDERKPTVKLEEPSVPAYERPPTTYQDRLDLCGDETEVWAIDRSGRQELLLKFRIPYYLLVEELAGAYEDGVGFVLKGSLVDNLGLLEALLRHSARRARAAMTGFC